MTPQQLERDGWSKMPSVIVSPGGSKHFYYRRNPDTDQREWYLKIGGEWTYRTDDADERDYITNRRRNYGHQAQVRHTKRSDARSGLPERVL